MDNCKYGFWEIFNKSFAFMVKKFPSIVKELSLPLVAQIFGIILSLVPLTYLTKNLGLKGDELVPYIIPVLILLVIGLIFYAWGFWRCLLISCHMVLASCDYFSSKELDFNSYKADILQRQGNYVKMLLWYSLFIFVICILGIFAVILTLSQKGSTGAVLAMFCIILMTLAIIFYSLKVSLVLPVFVFERDIKPLDVIKRSFEITDKSLLLVFGVQLVYGLILGAFNLALPLVTFPVKLLCITNEAFLMVYNIVIGFAALIFIPFFSSVSYLLYKRLN